MAPKAIIPKNPKDKAALVNQFENFIDNYFLNKKSKLIPNQQNR
jgi:hypothetical protein